MDKNTKERPYFSLIIPCLNEEEVLPLLLNDINGQIFNDFEIIVVDGKSSDKTPDIASHNSKTTLVVSTKRNVSYQRNLGAKEARGKYLVFFDADSRIDDYFLAGLAYKIQLNQPDIFTCWTKIDSSQSDSQLIANLINMSLEVYKFVDSPTAIGAMMGLNRLVFNKLGGFAVDITFGEDSEIVKRGAQNNYSYNIFRDPRYFYSLRRFKSEGTLTMLQRYAKLNSSILLKGYPTRNLDKDYPMWGGSLYLEHKRKNGLIYQIEHGFQKLKQIAEPKKWMKYWDRLIND